MRVRDLRDSAWRTFGRWLTNKNWSQLSSAESCKDKFHIFITELQNAVDTYLPWKTVRIHPTDRPWTTKRIKRLSLIVRMNVVLNRTVVVDSDWRFDNLCGSHLQSQSELYHVSWWYYTLVIDLIGQLRRNIIGRMSVKPWCYWIWRLVISNWCVSIHLLSQLNGRLLLVKLSVLQFSRS